MNTKIYTIEVKDRADSESTEPWSFYGTYMDKQHFLRELHYLGSIYIFEHSIEEFRVIITNQ